MRRILSRIPPLIPYQVSLTRGAQLQSGSTATTRRPRRLKRGSPLVAAAAVCAVGVASAVPVGAASTSGSSTGTVNVTPPAVRSITVSPASFTFGACYDHANTSTGSTLAFPNGYCYIANNGSGITITNGTAASHIDVQGADAVPSDAGTHWTLCTVGTSSCLGSSNQPGQDQFGERVDVSGQADPWLTNSTQCDTAFDAPTSSCAATAGQATTETLTLVGPSGSTDTSTTFSTVLTWTAAP